MGKSNKKAKSDNINALRKQYDAFLEEDQKRKKRNEYILGKLDIMRSSTALVPVRLKAYTPDHRLLEVHDVGYQPEISLTHDFQPSIANRKHIIPIIETKTDDSLLIQEISKKYILIPKLRSSFINNGISTVIPNHKTERLLNVQNFPNKGISPNTDESTDWKSKYDILNLLKNEEKETPKFNTQVEGVPKSNVNEKSLLINNYQQVANDYTKIKTDLQDVETSNKFLDELPEKDFYNATINYESNDNINEYNSGNINLISNKVAVTANTYDDPTDAINDKLQNITLEYNNSDAFNNTLSLNPTAKCNNDKTQPEYDINVSPTDADFLEASQNMKLNHIENNSAINNLNISKEQQQQHEPEDLGQDFNLDKHNISPMPVMSNQEVVKNINNSPSQGQENISSEVEDIQKSTPNDVEIKTNINKIEDMEIQDNIQPTYEHENVSEAVVVDNLNTVDISGSIEDFNTEQTEMFYSENNNDNSTYPSDDVDPVISDPLKNLEFDYYEGVPSAVYPVEVNDQEELTHKFDPTYEQQYLNADVGLERQPYEDQQQYEQQQHYEQQQYEQPQYDQQQYEQPEYDQQQYEQQQYEQQPQMQQEPVSYNQLQPELDLQINEHQLSESNERVEQMLDVEDGFVEQKQQVTEAVREAESHVSEAPERQHKEAVGDEKVRPREKIQASEQVIG